MTPEFPEAQAPHVRKAIAKARAAEYLKQRDAQDIAERAKLMNERLERDRKWLADYRASGKARTSVNWATVTKPINRSTTNGEEGKTGTEAQAAEVSHAEGVGNAPREEGSAGRRVVPRVEDGGNISAPEGDRWEREVDTPF